MLGFEIKKLLTVLLAQLLQLLHRGVVLHRVLQLFGLTLFEFVHLALLTLALGGHGLFDILHLLIAPIDAVLYLLNLGVVGYATQTLLTPERCANACILQFRFRFELCIGTLFGIGVARSTESRFLLALSLVVTLLTLVIVILLGHQHDIKEIFEFLLVLIGVLHPILDFGEQVEPMRLFAGLTTCEIILLGHRGIDGLCDIGSHGLCIARVHAIEVGTLAHHSHKQTHSGIVGLLSAQFIAQLLGSLTEQSNLYQIIRESTGGLLQVVVLLQQLLHLLATLIEYAVNLALIACGILIHGIAQRRSGDAELSATFIYTREVGADGLHTYIEYLRKKLLAPLALVDHQRTNLLFGLLPSLGVAPADSKACIAQSRVLGDVKCARGLLSLLLSKFAISRHASDNTLLQAIPLLNLRYDSIRLLLSILQVLPQGLLVFHFLLFKLLQLVGVWAGFVDRSNRFILLLSCYHGVHSILLGLPLLIYTIHSGAGCAVLQNITQSRPKLATLWSHYALVDNGMAVNLAFSANKFVKCTATKLTEHAIKGTLCSLEYTTIKIAGNILNTLFGIILSITSEPCSSILRITCAANRTFVFLATLGGPLFAW